MRRWPPRLAESLASIWRRPPGRRDNTRTRPIPPSRWLQSGGGLLAAGTQRALFAALRTAIASIWRRPPGRRDRRRQHELCLLDLRFNLAAASWPPGLGNMRRNNDIDTASIWRRPPGRRDPPRRAVVPGAARRFNLAAASWPPGRPTRPLAAHRAHRLQSGGGLLAAGTGETSRPAPAGPSFNLAAASWPPGRARCVRRSPARHPLQSGGGLLAAGTRRAADHHPRDDGGFNLAAASWPPGLYRFVHRSALPGASIWRRPPGRRDSGRETRNSSLT